ncbi:MAG: M23 family metallopeptidase [Anaerolineales bacterium]|nr:MAG: M23 family metallopeptidase [Anaerolineales bacterium]
MIHSPVNTRGDMLQSSKPVRSRPIPVLGLMVFGLLWVGCSTPPKVEIEPPQQVVTLRPTSAPTATSTATPTAPALVISDNRPAVPQDPNPLGLAVRCGVAELFDYPLDPPDADTVTGGQDFGHFRERYEGYHTGEDWWYERRNSLGKPLYSIGNGRVRYAAPYGWGDDLGTLVIEHTLPTGRRLYSFYGHVDPGSLTLRAGQCVERGQPLGVIGDPRSSPHLHFEIRYVFADSPGPGYWSIDPGKSGWLPPSQTIEFSRYAADQRVDWWRASAVSRQHRLGWLEDGVVLLQEDSDLLAIEVATGEVLLRHPLQGLGATAAWDSTVGQIYLADMIGTISAYRFKDPDRAGEIYQLEQEPLWRRDLDGSGSVQLIPYDQGVFVIRRGLWSSYSAGGGLLWTLEIEAQLAGWIATGEGVLVTTSGEAGDLWTLTEAGARAGNLDRRGELYLIGDIPYLYTRDGFFRIQSDAEQVQQIYPWSRAQPSQTAPLGLGGEGFLLLQSDVYDQRLLRIDAQGTLIWERSLEALDADEAQLVACWAEILLMTENRRPSSVRATLFRLDLTGAASEVFQTIVRETYQTESWMTCVDEGAILLSLGGQRLLRLDLHPASE